MYQSYTAECAECAAERFLEKPSVVEPAKVEEVEDAYDSDDDWD